MNYVDGDVILRKMQKIATEAWKMNITAKVEMIWNEAMDVIRFTPSADVAPVVRGKWVEQHSDFDLCGIVYYECSECKREQQVKWHYCPNCGAKMSAVNE